MAIITKPVGGILKGVPASISLSKSELSALSIIVADPYFSNMTNWNKVILKYRSSSGKQYEAVQFDATLSSPTGNFLVSIKARDAFEIQTIEIHDFDNDIFIVPRSALNVADFDVVLLSAPSSLSYSTPVTYTQNTAITNNVPTVTGTVTSYSILPELPAGLSLDPVTGVISGTPTEVSAAANYVVTASNGAGSTTATINITVEAEIIDEFWDVANKSGVGTVSVGANRLITKTSGGGAYDVNVLSLETITGDGYIEFPNSSLLNIGNSGVSVIGLAEQTSPNGGFQNIILGAFTVNNNWERVLDGSTAGFISATNPNDIVRIGRIGTEYYIKINDVIKTQVIRNNTNPLKASISLFTTGTGVDNITVESAEEFTGGPISWNNTSSGYLIELDGGVTTTAQRPSGPLYDTVYGSSSDYVTGDFIYEAEISTSLQSDSIVGFYDSITSPVYNTMVKGGATTLSFWLTNNWNNGTPEYTMAKPSGDTFLFKITRVGTLVKLFVNNVEIASETTTVSHLLVPFFTLRPNDYIVDAQIAVPEVPVGDPIMWDLFLNGATTEADGGLIGASTAAYSFTKSNASKIANGADFAITYKFTNLVADWVHGISSVLTEESQSQFNFTGLTYQQSALISYYRGVQQPNQSLSILNSPGENTLVIEKTGTNLTFTLNNTVVLSKTDYTEQLTVPAVRPWNVRALDSAYVEIQEAVVGDPILWQSKPGYIIEADGGATATSERPNYSDNIGGYEYYRVFAPSSQWVTGDFTFEAEINNAWGGNDYIGFYDSDTNFTMTTGFNGSQVRYEQSAPASYVKPAGDTYTLKMQRTGYVLKFYVNDVEVYSVTQANLSTVKVPFFTFTNSTKHIVSATLLLPTATNYINWDLLTGYQAGSLIITPTSGVSGGISLAGNDVAVKSDADKATGDFDYTFKFDWSAATSVVDMFAGVTGNNVTSGTSPLFYDRLTCIYGNGNNPDTAYFWHNGLPVGGTTQTLLSGVNTYRLTRVGTIITHYLNDVQIYSAAAGTVFTAYPSVRTMGNSVVTESYITEASIPVTSEYFTYTHNPDSLIISNTGGVSGGPQSSFGAVSIEDSFVGDFSIQFKFNWDSFTHSQGYGSMDDAVFLGVRTELNSIYNQTGIAISEFDPGNSNKNIRFFNVGSSNTLYNVTPGDHIFVLVRTGSDWKYYIDGVLRYQAQNGLSQPLYPAVKTRGFVACTESKEIEFVTWNVAGKTGVGTVTTGENGLITKATGEGAYNVNVLSNETIIGDGYVEFIWNYGNVVLGLAETNEPNGSYTNTVYGGYVAGNGTAGSWEQTSIGSFNGSAMLNNSIVVGDVIKIERVGNLYKAFKNGLLMHTCNINNTNPMKASISIYHNGTGIGGATISE